MANPVSSYRFSLINTRLRRMGMRIDSPIIIAIVFHGNAFQGIIVVTLEVYYLYYNLN